VDLSIVLGNNGGYSRFERKTKRIIKRGWGKMRPITEKKDVQDR